jgi:imidazolonepropionase-like amidohydrolase
MFPATTREVAKRAVVAHEQTLKMAKKAGVKIAMGTDSGSPYGNVHGKCQLWELELMATRGLTPMEAIVASTKTAAECIGIGEKTGTIESGKFADLLAVDGNPLDDIRVLQDQNRVKMVMKEGIPHVTRP